MISIVLELVRGYCNSRCQFCLMRGINYGTKSLVDVEDIKKFISLNKGFDIDYVSVVGMGEQTLHPDFAEIINLLSNNFRLKNLNSNLAKKMTKEDLHAVMKFEEIEVDIGAFNEDLRRKILGRKSDHLKENIEYLEQFLDSKQLQLKAVNTKKNIDDISNTHILQDYLIIWDKEMFEYDMREGFDYDEYVNELIDDRIIIVKRTKNDTTCAFASSGSPIIISPTGDILFCYLIPYNKDNIDQLSPGNAFERPINEIINTEKFQELKEKQSIKAYAPGFCNFCIGS